MNFLDLKRFDPSLELISPSTWDEPIQGISAIENPRPREIVFLKSRAYINKIGYFSKEKVDCLDQTGVVVDAKLLEELQTKYQSEFSKVQKTFGFMASSSQIDKTIMLLSGVFYEARVGEPQEFVDGRQLGNCEIHPSAYIAQNVFIGENVKIGAGARILPGVCIQSNSCIGDETILFPNVNIYSRVKIGKFCRIHAGVTIGSDGFGYQFIDGQHHKIWHMGGVVLENNIEVGANSCIDSGTFTHTFVGSGTKIDNLVQVGHNVHIGENVVICGNTAIGGSTVVEDYVVLAGMVAVCDNVVLGKGCQIAGNSAISNNVPAGAVYSGYPAKEMRAWIRELAFVKQASQERTIKPTGN